MRQVPGGILITLLAGGLFGAAPVIGYASEPADAADGAPTTESEAIVDAVWVEHELAFTYQGFTTHYSCNGISGKVRRVLREIGVRPGLTVRASACMNPNNGPELMPRVSIKAALPQAATPELLGQLDADRAQNERVARAQGKAAEPGAAVEVFPAHWQRIVFKPSYDSAVRDGDCELMEHLVKHVFGPMGIRVAEGTRLDCVPKQTPLYSVRLELDVLQPLPDKQSVSDGS
jgi:hypothetical protein